jgi:hypothetical protein
MYCAATPPLIRVRLLLLPSFNDSATISGISPSAGRAMVNRMAWSPGNTTGKRCRSPFSESTFVTGFGSVP